MQIKFAQVTSWCILDKRGGARTHPGIFYCSWLDVNFELEQYLGDDWWRFTSPQVQTRTHIVKRPIFILAHFAISVVNN